MQLTAVFRLYPTAEQEELIKSHMDEYVRTVNSIIKEAKTGTDVSRYTTADVESGLPSAVECQCIRDAKSMIKTASKRAFKNKTELVYPVLKRPVLYINNQNYKLTGDEVSFPMMRDGKCRRFGVRINGKFPFEENTKTGLLRLVYKNDKLMGMVTYEAAEQGSVPDTGNVMGVDLGIKCPAVSKCSDGSVRFYGNGRQNKKVRRHYNSRRRSLQKAKKHKALMRLGDKEYRYMRDQDHKISRAVVNEAQKHGVSEIRLELLENIRATTRKSRKNNHSLHNWSFARLAHYIEYKAARAGISVVYVNPAYTSQICPVCGKRNHANDRRYVCECGYIGHRDIVGAINIMNTAPLLKIAV